LGAVIAAFALSLPCASLAAVSSTASLTALQFELLDLNTSDGVAPSITFSPSGRSSVTGQVDGLTLFQTYGTSGFGSLSESASNGPIGVQASVDSSGLSAAGSASGLGYYFVYSYAPDIDKGFTLSPHTRLSVTVEYSLLATMGASDSGFAAAYVTIAIYDPASNPFQYAVQDQAFASVVSGMDAKAGNLQITFENNGSTALARNFYGYAKADGALSPIPEPSALTLALSGACVLGTVLRRRRRI
jgi:hypothetical protein